jgi:3-oxoacyl-[acyl-carrier protein] reductase
MADRYLALVNSPFGENIAGRLGLPRPAVLRRYSPGDPPASGPVLAGGLDEPGRHELIAQLTAAGIVTTTEASDDQRWAGLVFDARAAARIADLAVLRDFFAAVLRRLGTSGRVVVLGAAPDGLDPLVDATRQAIDGIVRSLAKELRRGATANLLLFEDGAGLPAAEGALRFFLSSRSAYVDGQVLRLSGGGEFGTVRDWQQPLRGKVAVVTGAARGIGAAIAEVLARDGAQVIVADLPAAGESLAKVANRISGTSLQVDISAADAAQRLVDHAVTRFGGLDIVVHNAGITRDKLLANMQAKHWDSVLAVNLESQLRVNELLLATGALRPGGRVVSLASTSGIAGNRGQTNYAASKAGVIGMVRSSAARFAEHGATINAVAPGFIETGMTHAMPLATREIARRLNSLQQAGLPVDVAEAIGFLSWPVSGSINGQVLRVCGQNLVGA